MITGNLELAQKGSEYFRAQLNPFCSEKKKEQILNKLLNDLSEGTFDQFATQFIMQLKFNKAKDYKDSESEADAFVVRYPRMKAHRGLLLERIKEYRLKHNLTV